MTMRRVLAIEPDRRQAAQLRSIARRLGIELLLVESAGHALTALGERLPDLMLTPALLSCRDDLALTERMRELGDAAAHIQTLTIPIFETAKAPVRGGGVLAALWRDKTRAAAPAGCDMDTFAEEIREYLRRAAELKRARPDLQAPTPAVPSDPAPHQDILRDAVIDARLGDSPAVTDRSTAPLSNETCVAVEEDLPGATEVDRSGDHHIATALVDMASADSTASGDIVMPDRPIAATGDAEQLAGIPPADETIVFGHRAPWFTGPADPVEEPLEWRKMLDAIDEAFKVASVGPEIGAIVAPDPPMGAAASTDECPGIPPAGETIVFGDEAPRPTTASVDRVEEDVLDVIDAPVEMATVCPDAGAIIAPDQPLAALGIDEELATIPTAPTASTAPAAPAANEMTLGDYALRSTSMVADPIGGGTVDLREGSEAPGALLETTPADRDTGGALTAPTNTIATAKEPSGVTPADEPATGSALPMVSADQDSRPATQFAVETSAPDGFVEPGPPPCDAPNEPLVRVRPAVKARARTRATARKKRADVPDDWSYFDPAQCRFAALVAKLDEIAAESQATSPKSRT